MLGAEKQPLWNLGPSRALGLDLAQVTNLFRLNFLISQMGTRQVP